MEFFPLGAYAARLPRAAAVAVALGAALLASLLLELSRTLSERAKGRWYAGNGRDVFHLGAFVLLACALYSLGWAAALACVGAGVAVTAPLLVLDGLSKRRLVRWGVLAALIAVALAPALIAPQTVAQLTNAVARTLSVRN